MTDPMDRDRYFVSGRAACAVRDGAMYRDDTLKLLETKQSSCASVLTPSCRRIEGGRQGGRSFIVRRIPASSSIPRSTICKHSQPHSGAA
jgi:hypothetical protein